MLKALITAFAVLCLISSAEARNGLHKDCNILFPCEVPYASTPAKARATRGAYVAHEVGFGAPVRKRHVRVSKARETVSSWRDSVQTYTAAMAKPSRYIAGRLICALNVNAALAERGIKGTGSALAKSFLSWGRSSPPVPGAVAVSPRRGGGHVAIVSRVLPNGIVMVWNPSPRGRGWQERVYRHRALDFRVAGG